MKNRVKFGFLVLALLSLGLWGCKESSGPDMNLRTTPFSDAQGGCAQGGIKIEVLADGVVDESQTQFICNGAQGQAASNADIRVTHFEDAQGSCLKGGVKIEVLEEGVVDESQTQYVCNGVEGSSSAVSIRTTPFSDAQGGCNDGGIKIAVFVNGILDASQTQYVCNGAQGLSGDSTNVRTTPFSDAQGDCAHGGIKIEVFANGVVDENQTQYVCNAEQEQASTTHVRTPQFSDAQGDCTHGEVKIEVFVDGVLDDSQTQYVCNGEQGQAGVSTNIRTTQFSDAQGDCLGGGIKVEFLIDGVVDETKTQYICRSLEDCQNDNGCRETAYCDLTTFICIDKKEAGASCTLKNQCLSGICEDSFCHCATQRECGMHKYCSDDGICTDMAYNVGDIVTFGVYHAQPIQWYILDKDETNHRVMLLAMDILDEQRFNAISESIAWKNSTIRSWLNGYAASENKEHIDYASLGNFISMAFTYEERTHIAQVEIENGSSEGAGTTSEWIFLLSLDEVKALLGTGTEICSKINCTNRWWLRTPRDNTISSGYFYGVNANGTFSTYSAYSGYNSTGGLGVRPALWLNY